MRLVFWMNCLFLAAAVYGQEAQRGGPPTVRAHGEATINVKPDLAQLNIGVVTQGQTADSAAGQNAKQTSDLIAALKKEFGTQLKFRRPGTTFIRTIVSRATGARSDDRRLHGKQYCPGQTVGYYSRWKDDRRRNTCGRKQCTRHPIFA